MIKTDPRALRFKVRLQNDPILATQPAKRRQENELEDRSQALWRAVSKRLQLHCTARDWGQM